jgi:hypothetical protein
MSWSINEGPRASHSEKSAASRCGFHESTLCAPHNAQQVMVNRIAIKATNGQMKNEMTPSPPNHNLVKLKTMIALAVIFRGTIFRNRHDHKKLQR